MINQERKRNAISSGPEIFGIFGAHIQTFSNLLEFLLKWLMLRSMEFPRTRSHEEFCFSPLEPAMSISSTAFMPASSLFFDSAASSPATA